MKIKKLEKKIDGQSKTIKKLEREITKQTEAFSQLTKEIRKEMKDKDAIIKKKDDQIDNLNSQMAEVNRKLNLLLSGQNQ